MQDNALAEFMDQRTAVSDADRFTRMALMVLDNPQNEAEGALAASEDALMTVDLPPEVYDRALLALASAIFTRPDFLDYNSVSSLLTVFRRAGLPAGTFRLAAEVMNFLLTTPVAARAVEATVTILSQPNQPSDVYEALLGTLRHAVTWAKELLDLETLSGLPELEHLSSHRDYLLQEIVEPCIYAAGESATTEALARIAQLCGGASSFKYCLYNIKSRSDFRPDVRELASRLLQGRFSLHEKIAGRLGSGSRRILVVKNVNDGQGDEIVRTVPLIQALLDFNPALDIILLTRRVYLHATPRITIIPFKDRDRITALLDQRFDAVIDFCEPTRPEANRDLDLEPLIQDYVRQHRPFLFVSSTDGYHYFVYDRIHVDSRPVAQSLGLNRPRAKNIYENTLRLIAELGLPMRCGEDPPATDWVLAGLPWNEAEAAWHELVRQNTEGRAVALLNPFGGAEPLKGFVERQIDKLSAMIRQLIRENFYVVVLPNGTPWGTASFAAEAIRRLEPHEQAQVVVGPDPACGSEAAPRTVPGAPDLTHPDRVVRMVTYFIRFADLIVAVEGWMVHAAYCLGKKYHLLMMAYSCDDRWHPYAATRHQQVAHGLLQCAHPYKHAPPTGAETKSGSPRYKHTPPTGAETKSGSPRYKHTPPPGAETKSNSPGYKHTPPPGAEMKSSSPCYKHTPPPGAASEEERKAPPILEQPRKFILLVLLREFGNAGDAQALGLLRWAARSEDRDLRQAAALSLGKLKTAEVVQDLISLLQDPSRGVRADAASALLEIQEQHGARPGDLPRGYLLDFVACGHGPRNWAAIIRFGEAARPALELALQDNDPFVRRQALQVKRVLDFKANLRRRRASLRTRLMRNRILRGLFGRG
jgi:ADP-heptose:LPS heptosyltransferase